MRVHLEGGCLVAQRDEGYPLRRGTLKLWRLVGRETGANAISLSALEFSPGVSPGLRNGECDEVLFVLSGEGTLLLDGQPHRVEPDTGIYVRPGVGVAVENPGPAPMTLLVSQCPDPGPVLAVEEPGGKSSGVGARSAAPIVRFQDQPVQPAEDGRSFRMLVDGRVGSEQVSQFVGFIPPGRAPEHFHEYEEVVCILEGSGRLWAGQTSTPVGPGSCVFLPRRQVHCLENTGAVSLKLYGLFYPAGSPAVRFQPPSP